MILDQLSIFPKTLVLFLKTPIDRTGVLEQFKKKTICSIQSHILSDQVSRISTKSDNAIVSGSNL